MFFTENRTGVANILMTLKLLQAVQTLIINWISTEQAIVLKNNTHQKETKQKFAKRPYTHIFTSLEIALSKKSLS